MIRSLTHPLVKHLVKLREKGEYRAEQNRVMIQGYKVVREVGQRLKLLRIVATQDPPDVTADEVIIASKEVLDKMAGVIATENIVAEVEIPSYGDLSGSKRVLALDGISDPGNLGTLLRTALAFGWGGVYLLPGCCDPYNDKALRAAMGATFKIRLGRGDVGALKQLCTENRLQAWVADLHGVPPRHTEEGMLLVLGNEARGPSEEVSHFCRAVTIPMQGDIESLNVAVAGAVLMYTLGGA